MPALPELPALAKHEKPGAAPAPPKGTYPCGAVFTGDEHVELVCLDEKEQARLERTATVLVPYEKLSAKLPPPPAVVDHRADGVEAAVRNQGHAGTCTTFGTSAAIDHSVARWTGAPAHVSVMQIWARYHQTSLSEALSGSAGKTLAAEETWPYDAALAWTWRDCPKKPPAKPDPRPCGQPVDEARLAAADAKPAVLVEQVELLPRDFELMRAKLAAGQDLVIAMRLGAHFKPVGAPGSRYVPDYDDEAGGHILAISGYAMMRGGGGGGAGGDNYYLLHNSWGTKWGDGGYAWIHEATLVKHMGSRFGIVDARPAGNGPRAHRGGQSCKGGLAPDSATGECAPECSDGSPQHGGVCPDPGDCPRGYVNLVGTCVAAAPSDASSDAGSHISWKCGPGGCAFTLPKAVGGCGADPCLVSCPAPSFRVAKDHQGITCIE
jgi:hypothetical protein